MGLSMLIRTASIWFFAVFYGIMVLFGIVKAIFKDGFGKVFKKTKRERPACLQNPDVGVHGFLHLENVKIHYVAKGAEDKPLMLFVHGFPEFWYSWRHQIKEFSNDYRCVAIDMRGYGESDKPSGIDNYQMKHLEKDIQQVIEALGYKTCVLVAHDWGAAVAWSFARHFPDYVEKLITMNCPSSPIMQKLVMKDRDQFKRSWYMFFFQLPYLPEFMIGASDFGALDLLKASLANPIPDEELEAYKYNYSQPGALTPPINFYRAALRRPAPMYDMDYKMPVLLIWGMDDTALSPKIPDMTEQASSDITVKRLEKSSHFVQFDVPERVNETMREWLSSQKG